VPADANTATRPARMGAAPVAMRRRADGTVYLKSLTALPDLPGNIVAKLDHWAAHAPERGFLADRGPDGAWRRVTFAEARARSRSLARWIIDAGLSAERPIVALSGNDIELGLLTLAAMYAGVPIAPVSPAYSLLSKDHAKLRYLFDLVTPGLVYVSDAAPYAAALAATMTPDIRLMVRENPPPDRAAVLFADAAATPATAAVDRARDATGPDTIAKFLFTSGTTGWPKAVINTQRMLTANQAMIAATWAFLADEPPVLCDWLPWNHTAGGNHNFGIALWHGGSLYIDDGNPTPSGIVKTARNLREISPTFYTNVPRGYEALVSHLAGDETLRRSFFRDLKALQYAGANLPHHVWSELERLSREATGQGVTIVTGYGATETAPFAFGTTTPVDRPGYVGLPGAGLEVKLVPNEDKLELRLKGPSITPGYWRQPEETARSFDEEGYYRIGDALAFADPGDVSKGFLFDGRIAEDFKLSTGTWVNTATVRSGLIAACQPLIRDAVLAGLDRGHVGALIFPDMAACRTTAGLGAEASNAEVVAHRAVVAHFRDALRALAAQATGSSMRVARAILLSDPPAIDAHEITDKGSINQRAVIAARAGLVEDLYREPPPDHVIVAEDRR
jgi:feruloyl-CoA synthase